MVYFEVDIGLYWAVSFSWLACIDVSILDSEYTLCCCLYYIIKVQSFPNSIFYEWLSLDYIFLIPDLFPINKLATSRNRSRGELFLSLGYLSILKSWTPDVIIYNFLKFIITVAHFFYRRLSTWEQHFAHKENSINAFE